MAEDNLFETEPGEAVATPEPTITPEELAKQVQYLQNSLKAEQDRRKALEEKAKTHNAEMVKKKEREREALEKERIALEKKGEYEKAMELLKQQLEESSQFKSEAENIRRQAEIERKRYKVSMALTGKIDPKVPVERAVTFVNLDEIELTESGDLPDPQVFIDSFLKKEEWLRPPVGGKMGAPPPPAGSAAASLTSKEAQIVAAHFNLPPEVVAGMGEDSIKGLMASMPQGERDYSELFK